ncbi:MAG: PEP-CTERM sorting domain-containing protein, partial [Phycisphaeraceae bacterium]
NGGTGGNGWNGAWAAIGDHTTVQPQVLMDPNGLTNGDTQAARMQATANLADIPNFLTRALPAITDTVYMSLLIRNVTGVDSGDFYSFLVSNGALGNTDAGLSIGIRNNANNPFFTRVGGSTNGDTDNAALATAGVDFLLVAKFSKDGSSNYNRVDLFINPTSLAEPLVANATSISGVTGINTLSLFSIRNFNPEAGDTVLFDNLRFATTFRDAIALVPEPSTLALGLAGLLSLGARRRRARV